MARVLHLFDHDHDYQTQTGVAQITSRDPSHIKLTIGRGGTFANPFMGILHLHKHLQGIDLIHAWSPDALAVASLSGRGKGIVYSPPYFPTGNDLRWVRAIMAVRNIQMVCPTDTMRRAFVQRGVPIERCHLIRPGVDFSKVNRRRNDELRTKLHFGKDDFVILASGESERGANHHLAILSATVLNVFNLKYKMLLWGRGPLRDSEVAYAHSMYPKNFITSATQKLGKDVTYEQLLPAADVIVIAANAPVAPLPIAIGMASAIPIVAVVTPTISEMLEDRHSCLLARKCTSRWVARRILDVVEEPKLGWMVADAARTEAFEYFSMTRFLEQINALYEQFATGKTIDLPQRAPGAGSRFGGRA